MMNFTRSEGAEARTTAVQSAIDDLMFSAGGAARGAVFTGEGVVALILDLCGYEPERDLTAIRVLEPAAGDGAFLIEIVRRLMASCAIHHGPPAEHVDRLLGPVMAVEVHDATARALRARVACALSDAGVAPLDAAAVADSWVRCDDFLLTPLMGGFDVIVGNPPYVRQERIAGPLLAEYRRRFQTLYDRADLYVPFYERCLGLLEPAGALGFICANRWVKNRYGGPLRGLVAGAYNLDVYIDLQNAGAFEGVDSYPAITILSRRPAGETQVVTTARNGHAALPAIAAALLGGDASGAPVTTLRGVTRGRDPWLVDVPEVLAVLRDLEVRLPTLEEAGARVGIGVATGADGVFLGRYAELPVEEARRLPMVMAGDVHPREIRWSGRGLINPWLEDGRLAPLDSFPQFAAALRAHEPRLRARHTARGGGDNWYRTIDRVIPSLTARPKLLIPDIKGEAIVAYDEGRFYPHHNLYVVTSDDWDLRALQAILRSSLSLAFVGAYCVRMAGGFLRFQAQYLRKIRIPELRTLSDLDVDALRSVASTDDVAQLDTAVSRALGLAAAEARVLQDFATGVRTRAGRA